MKVVLVSRIDDQRALAYTRALGDSLQKDEHRVSYEPATARAWISSRHGRGKPFQTSWWW